jgi:hypothetical protein
MYMVGTDDPLTFQYLDREWRVLLHDDLSMEGTTRRRLKAP